MGQLENRRLKLQKLLEDILEANGKAKNVYYQPPEGIKISYPCIVYNRQYLTKIAADNKNYLTNRQYRITYIDKSPISDVVDALLELDYCRYISHSVVDNLNHDTFEIYF